MRRAAAAASHCPDYCFPNRLESIAVLTAAMHHNPQDARAPYYLGNLWYHHRQYDRAIACWEQACDLDPHFATVWRNLGLAYFNKRQDAHAAWQAMERPSRSIRPMPECSMSWINWHGAWGIRPRSVWHA